MTIDAEITTFDLSNLDTSTLTIAQLDRYYQRFQELTRRHMQRIHPDHRPADEKDQAHNDVLVLQARIDDTAYYYRETRKRLVAKG